ncbi:hypothetical protein NKJ23_32620, partial [Mesorhizobium sp. M0184]|uniref:hypothetical protein n=1 Tax=unclassified Mesorhizobium TaxID=325217 RepID=UPI00333AC726
SSIASPNSRHNDGGRRPETNPSTATCKPSPAITTKQSRRLTRRVEKHRNGDHNVASGRQKLIAVHQGG